MPGGGGKGKGGSSSTVTVNNGPIDVDSDVTIDGLDDIGVTIQGGTNPVQSESTQLLDATIGGTDEPIRTDSRQELVLPQPLRTRSEIAVTEPIVTDNSSDVSVDVKPLAVDLCMTTTTNAGKLPQGVVRQPYHTHFAITWCGMEFLGFTLSGESKTVYENLKTKPSVKWPTQRSAPVKKRGAGLRVRIK